MVTSLDDGTRSTSTQIIMVKLEQNLDPHLTTSCSVASSASQGRRQDSSDNEDGDGSDDDTANGFGTSLEPQAKKVRK